MGGLYVALRSSASSCPVRSPDRGWDRSPPSQQLGLPSVTTLLVASEGGHLAELNLLYKGISPEEDHVWVTFDNPQSRSLLAGQVVHFAPFVGSRDLAGTARAAVWARNLLRTNRFDTVVSTGASIALAILPLASRSGAKCYYIESATRTVGPSLTGRLLTPFRSIHLCTQHERWANRRWTYMVSVFDGFRSLPITPPTPPRRIVVSLGMHKGFGFRRLLEQLVQIVPDSIDVLWQVGCTDTTGLDINSRMSLPPTELSHAMAESDVVITHAGVGSAMSALAAGKRPVLIPRRKRFKEQCDDHQALMASELERRELAFHAEADELGWADVLRAASWRVERNFEYNPLVRELQGTYQSFDAR
jgi:UDP-N-acetylglucosamine--N-acetylmuramyl-(pentapeptide) pyrophosphoryl-undecaprenol N-acetylglucosamine transferase